VPLLFIAGKYNVDGTICQLGLLLLFDLLRYFGIKPLAFWFISGIIGAMGNMLIGLCCAALLTAAGGSAPMPLLTANEHPWGRFLPDTWCIVQTVTVFNIDGRVTQSTQTVRTTLQSVDESGITLQETETLELGGGRITEKRPQVVKYDFFNEPIQDKVQIRQGEPEKLMIDRKVVPCAVRIYEQQTSGGHLTTTIWYTPHVYPYVLRVEKVLRSVSDGEGASGQIIRTSVTLVQETSALRVLRGIRRNKTYTLRTEEKVGNITRITEARCSWDVPGGLLESTTREFDTQNREIRRSTSRMTNYFAHEAFPVSSYRTWTVPATPVETVQ